MTTTIKTTKTLEVDYRVRLAEKARDNGESVAAQIIAAQVASDADFSVRLAGGCDNEATQRSD